MTVVQLKMAAAGDEQPNPDAPRITFDQFYAAYPRKCAAKVARASWDRIDSKHHPAILRAVLTFKKTEDWRKDGGKFIPYPATFLNQERWTDELDADLSMGQCAWNINGNRHGEKRCEDKGTVEKRGAVYCKAHGERVS